MNYVKALLSGLTAISLSLCVPGLIKTFQGIGNEKASGMPVLWAGLLEAAFSLRFWILAGALFAVFFAASRLQSKTLRVFLFWAPTLTVSIVVVGFAVLLCYLRLHSRQG